MPYRVSYRDTTDVNRLLAVTELLADAQLLIEAVSVEVPPAAGRLIAAEDLMLGLDLPAFQPPQTLDTAGRPPVVYLGGTIDARHNGGVLSLYDSPFLWQRRDITSAASGYIRSVFHAVVAIFR